MQAELIEDIQLELKLLRKLLTQSAPVRQAAAEGAASETEKLAAASLLQSFYNGVENILDALAEGVDGQKPTGSDRHKQLLARMSQATPSRPAVVSAELRAGLGEYLEFRNAYRYGHHFRLDWPLMAALVAQAPATLARLEADLDHFVRQHGKQRFLGRPEPQGLPDYWFAPPSRAKADRWQTVRGPVLLAVVVGIGLGVGLSAAVRYGRARIARKEVRADEIRSLIRPMTDGLRAGQAETTIRHAVGVLEFFDRDDWQFFFAGDRWERSGDVTGRSDSLGASAVLSLADGHLLKVEVRTAWELYVFAISGGRASSFAQYNIAAGRPQSMVKLDPAGRPIYIGRWVESAQGTSRRDTYYRDGRALAETLSHPPGNVRKLILRTGPGPDETVTFAATPAGHLARDPNATTPLPDLPAAGGP